MKVSSRSPRTPSIVARRPWRARAATFAVAVAVAFLASAGAPLRAQQVDPESFPAREASGAATHPPSPGATAKREIVAAIDAEYASLEALYKELHAAPELSFLETKTAARMASELRAAGFEVAEGVGGTGVVAVLRNGEGPTLMLRADMDALPVKELTGLPYASAVVAKDPDGNEVPVMHACGHDVHMASLVGTARVLAKLRDRWSGTVAAIAQPAEERGAGAKAMIDDGLFERFPRPDTAIALHVDSSLRAGTVGYTSGAAMANVDAVDIVVRGIGGHGAYPEATKDPVVIAAQLVMSLQTIVSREVRAIDPAVVTVGSIHGGTKHNIVPNEVKLQLTVRSYTDEVRAQILAAIERIARGVARTAGLGEDMLPIVEVRDEYTPALHNDPGLTENVARAFRETLGAANVLEREPMMGGEDFGRYGRVEPKIPILMFRLGSISEEQAKSLADGTDVRPILHSSFYRPDLETTLRTGVLATTAAALHVLGPARP